MSTPSTPASPPLTVRPWARAGVAARRLPSRARAGVVALLHLARRLLARVLWLLRGWAGLLAGVLAALAIWLGPAAGARWIAATATALYRQAAAAVTLWYQTAYDAVAWPAANGLTALRATQAWARHGLHGLAPTIRTTPWAFWMRHGAAWRYATLQSPSGAPVRAALPLELGGALGLLALCVVVILIGLRKRGLDPTRANTYGGARWQTWDELRRRRAKPGDLVLGTARRGLRRLTVGIPAALLVEGVAICAPNGLGKSNAIYKGQLLEADPAVDYVATDPKGEHWAQTAAAMSRTHDVFRLDMQTPADSVTWAPLSLERTQAQAEAWAAAWLRNTTPAGSAPAVAYFEQALILLIAAGVAHVHAVAHDAGRATGTLGELIDLLLLPTIEKIEARLQKTPGGIPPAAGQFLGLIKEHKDLRTSIPSGLAPRLSTLTDAAVRAVVGGVGTLDLDRLGRRGRRPLALYIVTPVGDRTLRPLVGGLFTTLFRVLMDRARTLPGGALEREVRLLLDEFGTMGAVPDAPDRFNVLRQVRVSRVLSFQMRSQLIEDYDETGAEALVESCNALAWLGGTRGKDAQWASDTLGKRTVLASSAGDSAAPGGLFGRTPERDSRSVSEAGVPLLFPEDLHASSRRRIIVSVREARPMDLRTRPFYTVRALRRLSKLPAPPACVDAPAPSAPAPVAPAATQTPARADARVVPVPVPTPTWGATPDAARGATPATVPSAPVRVTAKTPAATATAVPPPALASATSTPPAAPPVTSGPARLPTAPVKHGTAYDWTGLP
jgi:type IV secretory pathway TraG/TraD family ATPase VirD4